MVSTSYFCNDQMNSHLVCRSLLSEPWWTLCAENEGDVDTIFRYIMGRFLSLREAVKLLEWFLSWFGLYSLKLYPLAEAKDCSEKKAEMQIPHFGYWYEHGQIYIN